MQHAFIVFQYSNGIGHLTRCTALAQALAADFDVTLFSGGRELDGRLVPDGVDFVQLPPTRWDRAPGARPVPVHPERDGADVDRSRSAILVEHFHRLRPAVVVLEYYPFAPRRFGATLDALLDEIERAPRPPLLVCSIRAYPRLTFLDSDTDPAWVNAQLRRRFACVLHHADPDVIPVGSLGTYLEAALRDVPVVQTGFVRRARRPDAAAHPPFGLLLTVGGGSAQGARMLLRWIEAARRGPPELRPLHVVCGPGMQAADRMAVTRASGPDVTVHASVPDLDPLIGASRGVVCMGGYNTAIEAVSLGKPALAFPNGSESDQQFQVDALASGGLLLRGDSREGVTLEEIGAQMRRLLEFRPARAIDCDGARRSARIVRDLLASH